MIDMVFSPNLCSTVIKRPKLTALVAQESSMLDIETNKIIDETVMNNFDNDFETNDVYFQNKNNLIEDTFSDTILESPEAFLNSREPLAEKIDVNQNSVDFKTR